MKRWIFENLGLKVLALVIAVALWANVDLRQVLDRRRMTVHLEFVDVPVGMVLAPETKNFISVLLIGNKEKIQDLDPDDLDAAASLRGAALGAEEISVRPKVQALPDGVTASVREFKVRLVPVDPNDPIKNKKNRR